MSLRHWVHFKEMSLMSPMSLYKAEMGNQGQSNSDMRMGEKGSIKASSFQLALQHEQCTFETNQIGWVIWRASPAGAAENALEPVGNSVL
jgi:hypothetical protein